MWTPRVFHAAEYIRTRTYACGLHAFSTRPNTYVRVRTHVDSTRFPRRVPLGYVSLHFSSHFASHFASHFSHFSSHFSHFSSHFSHFASHFSHFASHFSHFASHSSHYGPIRPDGPIELNRLIRLPAHTPICL